MRGPRNIWPRPAGWMRACLRKWVRLRLRPTRSVDAGRRRLAELTARRQDIVSHITAETQRLAMARDPNAPRDIGRLLGILRGRRAAIEKEIACHTAPASSSALMLRAAHRPGRRPSHRGRAAGEPAGSGTARSSRHSKPCRCCASRLRLGVTGAASATSGAGARMSAASSISQPSSQAGAIPSSKPSATGYSLPENLQFAISATSPETRQLLVSRACTRSTSSRLRLVEANALPQRRGIASTSLQNCGRWIGASSRRGGGSVPPPRRALSARILCCCGPTTPAPRLPPKYNLPQ